MILNALRPEPHPNHLTIKQSIAYLKQIRARTSLITHISHNSEHRALQKQPSLITLSSHGMATTESLNETHPRPLEMSHKSVPLGEKHSSWGF